MRLSTSAVSAEVSATAAMLTDAVFRIGGREVRPLARAPWLDEPRAYDGLVGHLRVLGGEFVGVPFGASGAPDGTAATWAEILPDAAPDPAHGRSADAVWEVVSYAPDRVVLGLDYPEQDAISRLERTIQLRPDAPVIEFELVVHTRQATRVPIGLHPILALPQQPAALELAVQFRDGYTYPGTVWPGQGRALPASRFTSLEAVPAADGVVNLSRLPLDAPIEDIVLLAGVDGPVRVHNRELGATIVFDWDRAVLRSVMLWISDRALQEAPWEGRYRGLGVEAIAGAFDFGETASAAANPIAADGHRTAVDLVPGAPLRITSSIAVETL